MFSEFIDILLSPFGGASVVLVALSAWLGTRWEKRISLRELAKHQKNLEDIRHENEKKLNNQNAELSSRIKEMEIKHEKHIHELSHKYNLKIQELKTEDSFKLNNQNAKLSSRIKEMEIEHEKHIHELTHKHNLEMRELKTKDSLKLNEEKAKYEKELQQAISDLEIKKFQKNKVFKESIKKRLKAIDELSKFFHVYDKLLGNACLMLKLMEIRGEEPEFMKIYLETTGALKEFPAHIERILSQNKNYLSNEICEAVIIIIGFMTAISGMTAMIEDARDPEDVNEVLDETLGTVSSAEAGETIEKARIILDQQIEIINDEFKKILEVD